MTDSISDAVDSDALQDYVNSITEGWPIILASVFMAMLLGFIYLIYIRCCVGLVIWLTIIAYNLLILALAILCLTKANEYEDEVPPNT